jgi:protease PrsW
MPDINTVIIAFFAGLLPALLWLLFWLREDSLHPEPKKMIVYTFLFGMAMVPVAIVIQGFIRELTSNMTHVIIFWSATEEILKYLAAAFIAFRTSYFDEPVDALVYMITVALGFAALENTLFLLGPLTQGEYAISILMGNFRFIGATLLHIISSAAIGVAIALSFYENTLWKEVYILSGVVLATTLHSLFNFSIISSKNHNLVTFAVVWVSIVILILFFEKVKKIKRPRAL